MLLAGSLTGLSGVVVASLAFFAFAGPAYSQSCANTAVHFPNSVPRNLDELVVGISQSLQMSVLFEGHIMKGVNDHYIVSMDPSGIPLSQLVKRMGTNQNLSCVIENKVVHIFDPATVSLKRNPLNHVFQGFGIQQVAEFFAQTLRTRLQVEAFNPRGDTLGGPGGGALPANMSNALIHPEIIFNTSARDVFLREAQQARMVLVVDVLIDSNRSPAEVWKETQKSLYIAVVQ